MVAVVVTRPAPPFSLTRCWDKARWHFEAPSFPTALGEAGARAHIVACLRFLDARGQLTAAGKRANGELLIDDHVRQSARAFLDESYDAYLARTAYGARPPVRFLARAWSDYERRFDLTRRSKPTAYQALLSRVPGRTLDDLLWELRTHGELLDDLRAAQTSIPPADRALVDVTIALHDGDPVAIARTHDDPGLVLFALRYLGRRQRAAAGLKAAATLASRLGLPTPEGVSPDTLESLAYALHLELGPKVAEQSCRALAPADRKRLARVVEALRAGGLEDAVIASATRLPLR